MDLARAPRRARLTARKKGSGYENGLFLKNPHPRPQAHARAALTVALGQAVDLPRNSDAEAWSQSICIAP